MAKVIAVCKSKEKGTKKRPVTKGILRKDYGLIGDAHADCCNYRQVSLLAIESINKMRSLGFDVGPGDFAENLTTEGIDLVSLPIGTRTSIGEEIILEVTQIGKECHTGCAIYRQIGKCIMPKEGVFAKVIQGGLVKSGDQIRIKKMDNEVEKIPILRFTEEGGHNTEVMVAREFPLTIILNDQELVTLLCSPIDLRYLAVGFLSSEGLLESKEEIKKILVDDERGVVRLETTEDKVFAQDVLFKRVISSGCGRGASLYSAADVTHQKVESQLEMSVDEVVALALEFQRRSDVWLATHGVHSAALCDRKSILVFSEDIGRHNAIDKIFGKCLMEDILTQDRVVLTSGRISSEILHKVAKRGVPIIISISVPTNLGVRIANTLGITLVASVRGKRMSVYTNGWRIVNSLEIDNLR